ncbi:MAG: hypothetical protein F6J98_02415 [Moorea sp. SIO4G2]|nr:hypothetical protein [Moorena sp. SIO4G2]
MDVSYPLRYSNGSLETAPDQTGEILSNARSLLDTIAGERFDPGFGIDYSLFFTTGISGAIAEEAQSSLSRSGFLGITRVVGEERGVITIDIFLQRPDGSSLGSFQQTIQSF